MKHKGAKMMYAQERINDLMTAYRQYITTCRHLRMPEAYNTIVNMPSKRFWVSDIRAALVVSAMLRGETPLETMWPLKREMYQEIYRRVLTLREEHPHLSTSELCSLVVAQPAPKFYLTPGSAKMMICKVRQQKRKQEKSKKQQHYSSEQR